MTPIPGPKKVKIRPAGPHAGPNSRRITSLPTRVKSPPAPMPTNATTARELRKYRLYRIGSCFNRLRADTATTVRGDTSWLAERLYVKTPSHQKVVHITGEVIDAEVPVGIHRKPNHERCSGRAPRRAGDP